MININEIHSTGFVAMFVRLGMMFTILFIVTMVTLFNRLLSTLKRFLASLPLSERANIHAEKVLVPISGRTHAHGNRHGR